MSTSLLTLFGELQLGGCLVLMAYITYGLAGLLTVQVLLQGRVIKYLNCLFLSTRESVILLKESSGIPSPTHPPPTPDALRTGNTGRACVAFCLSLVVW